MFIYLLMSRNVHQENFDDTKGVIRGHKSKKKQCNIKTKRHFFDMEHDVHVELGHHVLH
jgi:hypothetical protein